MTKQQKRVVCAWTRCREPTCDDSPTYCRVHLAESSKAPRGHSCMADECDRKTGGADKLYCREHARERSQPEHRRPETDDRVVLHVGVDGVLCQREARPAGRRPREAAGADEVEAEAWGERMCAARGQS